MKAIRFLLVLGMLTVSASLNGAACPEVSDLNELPVVHRADEREQTSCCSSRRRAGCVRFMRRPAVRCALRLCCISSVFLVGFFLRVDLLNLMNTNIAGFNNLMMFLWPDNEEHHATGSREALPVAPSHSLGVPANQAGNAIDDAWIIPLLLAQFPEVCADLHIRLGEPIPERAKDMFRFFTAKPKPHAGGRGAHEDEAAMRARLADSIQPSSLSQLRAFSRTFSVAG